MGWLGVGNLTVIIQSSKLAKILTIGKKIRTKNISFTLLVRRMIFCEREAETLQHQALLLIVYWADVFRDGGSIVTWHIAK